MSDSEALQRRPEQPPMEQSGLCNNVSEIKDVAEIMAKSGFFDDAKSASQAAVKIMAGRELGIPEMAAMRGVYVANGNTELSGPLLAALIKRSDKYDYQPKTVTDEEAEISFYEEGEEKGTASFSLEEARDAGLVKDGSAWDGYPSDMCFWRALSRGQKRFCPEIGWGATSVWGESGAEKVEVIKEQTGANALPEPDEPGQDQSEQEETGNGDGLPFEEDAELNPNTRKAIHATGKDVYGDDWDQKRAEIVSWSTDGRTDSLTDISEPTGQEILAGIREKQNNTPQMVTEE